MIPVSAWAAHSPTRPLAPWRFERRDPGPRDVRIEILFCGVCHSDLHFARGEWGEIPYPAVPGHEIVGRVTGLGREVTDLAVGDMVAVGCLVDSCRTCPSCAAGLEQYCDVGATGTYMGIEKETGRPTYGGYSSEIVVDRHFVLRMPVGLDLASAAPLLCAGITTWSPLRHWKVGRGTRVGIVGLGGLGHMGVKLAAALGAEVTLFTTSPGKERDAERLGATRVVRSREPGRMAKAANSLDLIIDTVSVPHLLDPLLETLYRDGTLVIVGLPPWRTSYREAEQALEMATQLDERQPIFFGDLSVYRLLFKMAEHPDLVSFCNETLGALTHYDQEQNSNLVVTLEAFFAHHGNLSQTAEALFIHRNTLQYRMDRIAEIASIDLDNPETRLALQLAIKANRLLNARAE